MELKRPITTALGYLFAFVAIARSHCLSASSSSTSAGFQAQSFESASIPSSTTPASTTMVSTSSIVAPNPISTSAWAASAYTSSVDILRSSSATVPILVPSASPAPFSTPSGSSTGECSSRSPCEGDITYYTAGLGACGIVSDGNTKNVVALPHCLMGTESNDNPYCGRNVSITCIATGKKTTATVVDKCMGCDGYSIDLSNAAFLDLDQLSVGRMATASLVYLFAEVVVGVAVGLSVLFLPRRPAVLLLRHWNKPPPPSTSTSPNRSPSVQPSASSRKS